MKDLRNMIEQLEEAGNQLDRQTPTSARMALMLTDNVAELLMYGAMKQIMYQEQYGDPWKVSLNPVKPEHRWTTRTNALRSFPGKVEVLSTNPCLLSSDQASIFSIGHSLRNEAYHRGILRERVIESISRVYFEIVCDWMRSVCFDVGLNIEGDKSIVAELRVRYRIVNQDRNGNWIGELFLSEEEIKKIIGGVLRKRECSLARLGADLACDINARISEVRDLISYLAENRVGNGITDEEELKEIQFWFDRQKDVAQ